MIVKDFLKEVADKIVDFLLGILGISSKVDLITNEIRKALFLISISIIIFFISFIIVVALFLTPTQTVMVPNIVGDDILDGLAKLENSKLIPSIEFQISQDKPRGQIIRQIPSPGNIVREGKIVKIFVSIGSGEFVLPDFSGQKLEDVKSFLSTKGVYVSSVEYIQSGYEIGTVVKTLPSAGTKVKPGMPIVIYVSSGSENNIPMPGVIGLTYENAMLMLDSKNINFKITPTATSDPQNDGIVLDQIPKEGEIITKDSTPEIIVGVFGDETSVQTTRFVLYKANLSSFSREGITTYYVDIQIQDQSGTKTIKKVLNNLTYFVLPLRIKGIATLKILVNNEIVKEETL